jgi:uncharacterized SAM-binding protein YcdF (DUF218 family)
MLIVLPVVLILLAGLAAYCAPRFLAYADKPVQSDAVILFIGSDARNKEARRLLEEGYGKYLIVPAFHQVLMRGNIALHPGASGNTNLHGSKGYPGFYENTHIEMLHAKETMDAMGLKSAIMVSSPYHMRRIRMISKKVFGEQVRYFSYVATRHVSNPTASKDADRADWTEVFREYLKICCFWLYSRFC